MNESERQRRAGLLEVEVQLALRDVVKRTELISKQSGG